MLSTQVITWDKNTRSDNKNHLCLYVSVNYNICTLIISSFGCRWDSVSMTVYFFPIVSSHHIGCRALPLPLFGCVHWDLFIPRLDFIVKPGSENSSRNDAAHFNLPPDSEFQTFPTRTVFDPSSEHTLIIQWQSLSNASDSLFMKDSSWGSLVTFHHF